MNEYTEQWLPVLGYEGVYEVSDLGRIRSLDREVVDFPGGSPRVRTFYGRLLSLYLDSRGLYMTVRLKLNGQGHTRSVHRIVLEAFVGPCPNGMECCHANDVKDDNRLSNLRWDTSSENKYDKVSNGRDHHASRTHCKHGHEYTTQNTRLARHPKGVRRVCLTCQRRNKDAWKRRRASICSAPGS